jgi:hypothetical protein
MKEEIRRVQHISVGFFVCFIKKSEWGVFIFSFIYHKVWLFNWPTLTPFVFLRKIMKIESTKAEARVKLNEKSFSNVGEKQKAHQKESHKNINFLREVRSEQRRKHHKRLR